MINNNNNTEVTNETSSSIDKVNGKIKFFDKIPLTYSDPITTLYIDNNYLLFGTSLGCCTLYTFESQKIDSLISFANEPISVVKYNSKLNSFIVLIGDEEALQIHNKLDENGKPTVPNISNNVFTSEQEHLANCESSYVLNSENKIMVILLNIENLDDYEVNKCNYYIIDVGNYFKKTIGSFEISNYTVPFDFNTDSVLFLEQFEGDERAVSIYNVTKKDFEKHNLPNDFGKITFMRLLPNSYILIVKNYYYVELYNDKFKLIYSIDFQKKEVEAIDIYQNENKVIFIIFLDSSGRVSEYFIYNNKLVNKYQFNIFSFPNIELKYKKIGLFDLDFPYYIKANSKFIAISTDQFCLIFQKKISS